MNHDEAGRAAAKNLRERNVVEAARICAAVEALLARLRGDEKPPRIGYESVGRDPFYEQTVGR